MRACSRILASVRHDPQAPTVVLSPHLDDAVLSAFTVLEHPGDVLVINVCDGMPPPGRASDWVRLCGGNDDAIQMQRRRAEDQAALVALGRRAFGLGFLEADERSPDAHPEQIARRTTAAVASAARILAPLGMGSHPDHLATRDAAMCLSRAEPALPLELYADLPYAIRAGWPSWVSAAPSDPHLDPDVPWQRALRRVPVPPDSLIPIIARLDAAQRARKASVLERYASQIAALAGGPHRRFDADALAFEVRWRLTPRG
jgi:LmbE family N-acetylglucosaminyl deacetylase